MDTGLHNLRQLTFTNGVTGTPINCLVYKARDSPLPATVLQAPIRAAVIILEPGKPTTSLLDLSLQSAPVLFFGSAQQVQQQHMILAPQYGEKIFQLVDVFVKPRQYTPDMRARQRRMAILIVGAAADLAFPVCAC